MEVNRLCFNRVIFWLTSYETICGEIDCFKYVIANLTYERWQMKYVL